MAATLYSEEAGFVREIFGAATTGRSTGDRAHRGAQRPLRPIGPTTSFKSLGKTTPCSEKSQQPPDQLWCSGNIAGQNDKRLFLCNMHSGNGLREKSALLFGAWHGVCFCLPSTNTPLEKALMNHPARQQQSSQTIPADLEQLGTAIERLPLEHRQTLEPIFARVLESTRRRRRILAM